MRNFYPAGGCAATPVKYRLQKLQLEKGDFIPEFDGNYCLIKCNGTVLEKQTTPKPHRHD
ncbi:MAG: hypothetical protein K1X81_11440 [Bacteroidia bacterium]|nr:hypothetical protein [Bacteroidia bacterium]